MRNTRWALAFTLLILLVTLLPGAEITGPAENLPSTFCLVCGQNGGSDGILNVLLFVPLGLSLMAASDRPLRMVMLVLALSTAIEVLQGIIPGRYSNLGDVVYNVVGGGLGVGLAVMRDSLLRPSRRVAAALTLGAGAAAGALFLLVGVLLAPSFPASIYYGQWTADLHFMEAYEGRVLEASLGPMFLGSERVSDPELAVDLVRAGAPLDARLVAGPAPPALAPIVSIFDEFRSEIMVLGADRTDLVLRVRYRAQDFRLQRPDLRVRYALAGTLPGDTIRLRAAMDGRGYSLRLDQHDYGPLRHTPGEGWALLLHPGHTAPWVDLSLGIAWVAGLLVLAGWWAPGFGWAAGALAMALVGMVLAGVAGPLMEVAPVEILAAIGGVLTGLLLGRPRRGGRLGAGGYASVEHTKIRGKGPVPMTGPQRGILDG